MNFIVIAVAITIYHVNVSNYLSTLKIYSIYYLILMFNHINFDLYIYQKDY